MYPKVRSNSVKYLCIGTSPIDDICKLPSPTSESLFLIKKILKNEKLVNVNKKQKKKNIQILKPGLQIVVIRKDPKTHKPIFQQRVLTVSHARQPGPLRAPLSVANQPRNSTPFEPGRLLSGGALPSSSSVGIRCQEEPPFMRFLPLQARFSSSKS